MHSPTSRVSGAVGIAGTGVAGDRQAAPDVHRLRRDVRTVRCPAATVCELRSGAHSEEELRISARLSRPPSKPRRGRTASASSLAAGRGEVSRRKPGRGRPESQCCGGEIESKPSHLDSTPQPARSRAARGAPRARYGRAGTAMLTAEMPQDKKQDVPHAELASERTAVKW